LQGLQGLVAAQGLQGFAAAQGLQGLQGFKRSFLTAQGLQGLHGFAAAQGLQGLQPAAIWIGVPAAWDTAVGRAIAAVARVATLRATTVLLIIKTSKKKSCRRFGDLRSGAPCKGLTRPPPQDGRNRIRQ
jgi:hypothetical protein